MATIVRYSECMFVHVCEQFEYVLNQQIRCVGRIRFAGTIWPCGLYRNVQPTCSTGGPVFFPVAIITSNLQRSWGAEVSKKQRNYRKEWCVGGFCITHPRALPWATNKINFPISTFSELFYWNLYFLLTFPLKSLLSLNFPIEISTFSSLSYWNLYFLWTFLLKSLLSLNFHIEISTFFELSYWNLYFLFAVLLKSLYFFYFPIEISTFF